MLNSWQPDTHELQLCLPICWRISAGQGNMASTPDAWLLLQDNFRHLVKRTCVCSDPESPKQKQPVLAEPVSVLEVAASSVQSGEETGSSP